MLLSSRILQAAAAVAFAGATLAAIAQSNTPAINQARQQLLAQDKQVIAGGPYQATWQSLEGFTVPEWFRDAKFGIFIHWGVYSVPAFNSEWYPRNMYQKGSPEYQHQIATHGPETAFGYKDYIPMFRGQNFDAKTWAQLFRAAGARYVVPVAEHHDGFAMYNSGLSEWTAVKMGPHRDVIGELATAVRADGMHFGLSSHRAEHYWFYDGGFLYPSDVQSQKYASLYGYPLPPGQVQNNDVPKDTTHPTQAFLDDWLARDSELVVKYHPEMIYFDWWINKPDFAPNLREFAAFYYDYAKQHDFSGAIVFKQTAMPQHTGIFDVERGQLSGIRALPWESDTSVSNRSWGYIQGDTFKTPGFIVDELADIVSKNGNLLLNIGPRSDGTIPEPVKNTLLAVGAWLRVNGDAIYGTRPWTQFGEGPTHAASGSFHDTDVQPYTPEDFRFTAKNGSVYAIELARPKDGRAVIRALASGKGATVKDVALLGAKAPVRWRQTPEGLLLKMPDGAPQELAYVYRIRTQ